MANNLNLEKVARNLTPKLAHAEPEYTLATSHRVRAALDLAGNPIAGALPIIERVAISRQQPGKPAHNPEDIAATLAQLEAMPETSQRWLSIASFVCQSAPASEREDFQQEVYLKLLEEAPQDIPLAWAQAHFTFRTCLINWTRYHGHVEPMSSPAPYALDASDSYVERTIGDLAADVPYDAPEFAQAEERLDALALWTELSASKRTKTILDKRVRGEALPDRDRQYLSRWLRANQDRILATA